MSTPSSFRVFCDNCSHFIQIDYCSKCRHDTSCGTHLGSCHKVELSTDSPQVHFFADVSSEVKADLEKAVIGLGASWASQWEIEGQTGKYYLWGCIPLDDTDENSDWHDLVQETNAAFIAYFNETPEPIAITNIRIRLGDADDLPLYYCIFAEPIVPFEELRKDVKKSYGFIDVKRRDLTRVQKIDELDSLNFQNDGFSRFFWGRELIEEAICPWAGLDSGIFSKWIYHHLAATSKNISDDWLEDRSRKGIEATQFRHSGELVPDEKHRLYTGYILRVHDVVLPPGWSSETVLELAKSTHDFYDLIWNFRDSLKARGSGLVRRLTEVDGIPFLDFLRENFPEHDFLIRHMAERSSSGVTRYWPFNSRQSMQVFSMIDGIHWACVDTKFDPSFGAFASEGENLHFYDTRANWARTNLNEVDHDAFFSRLRKQDEDCLDPKLGPLLF